MHDSAWVREGAGAEYQQARPDYSTAGITEIASELGVSPQSTVLDLAAGTGKLARALRPLAGRVIAVEPAAPMRAEIARLDPAVEVMAGFAEEIPLADASIDAVFVGDAFHWFDGERALAEIARVLVPGGAVAVLWHIPDARDDEEAARWYRDVWAAFAPYRERVSAHSEAGFAAWRGAFERSPHFGPLEHRRFEGEQRWSRDGFLAYAQTWSHVAALDPATRADAVAAARETLAGAPDEGSFGLHTDAWWALKRDA